MNFWKYIFGVLLLILATLIIAVTQLPDGNLHVIACNVGLGDAILITYGNNQILTDGGAGQKCLELSGKVYAFLG